MSRSRRRPARLQPDQFPDDESYVRAVHDRGLAFDLGTLTENLDRRRALMVIGGGVLGLAGCAATPAATDPSSATTSSTTTSSTTAASGTAVTEIPRRRPDPTRATGPTARTCWPRTASSGRTSRARSGPARPPPTACP